VLGSKLRGKIRKRRKNRYRQEQLCIVEFWTRYPEYALREEIIANRALRAVSRGKILLFMSRNRVVPEEADTM